MDLYCYERSLFSPPCREHMKKRDLDIDMAEPGYEEPGKKRPPVYPRKKQRQQQYGKTSTKKQDIGALMVRGKILGEIGTLFDEFDNTTDATKRKCLILKIMDVAASNAALMFTHQTALAPLFNTLINKISELEPELPAIGKYRIIFQKEENTSKATGYEWINRIQAYVEKCRDERFLIYGFYSRPYFDYLYDEYTKNRGALMVATPEHVAAMILIASKIEDVYAFDTAEISATLKMSINEIVKKEAIILKYLEYKIAPTKL